MCVSSEYSCLTCKAHVPEMRQKQLQQLVEEFVTPVATEKVLLVGDFNVDCKRYHLC